MPREKEDYRENLRMIMERFGGVQLIPFKQAAAYCGADVRYLRLDEDFPLKKVGGRYYVPAVGLARYLS